MWEPKLDRLKASFDEFKNWKDEREEQTGAHKVWHGEGQMNKIHNQVCQFFDKLQDCNKFLDNMVKSEQLNEGKQTVENTQQIAEIIQQIARNIQQIAKSIQQIEENTQQIEENTKKTEENTKKIEENTVIITLPFQI